MKAPLQPPSRPLATPPEAWGRARLRAVLVVRFSGRDHSAGLRRALWDRTHCPLPAYAFGRRNPPVQLSGATLPLRKDSEGR
jgi:hypothetical protein